MFLMPCALRWEKAKINRVNTPQCQVFIIVLSVWASLIFGSMDARNLLWSNSVVALAASACVMTSLLLGQVGSWKWQEALFACGVGSATWVAYTWQRHVKSTRPGGLRPAHLEWHRRHTASLRGIALVLLALSVLPLIQSALAFPVQGGSTPWIMGGLLVTCTAITALYAGLPGERGMRHALRRIPGVKMIWIAGAWATITALWPVWWASGEAPALHPDAFLLWGERFLVIAALTLPFDLRDRNWDPAGMRTWPQVLGPKGTRILAFGFIILAGVMRLHLIPGHGLEPLGALWAMGPAVLMAREDRPMGYYGILDSLLVLDAFALILIRV